MSKLRDFVVGDPDRPPFGKKFFGEPGWAKRGIGAVIYMLLGLGVLVSVARLVYERLF